MALARIEWVQSGVGNGRVLEVQEHAVQRCLGIGRMGICALRVDSCCWFAVVERKVRKVRKVCICLKKVEKGWMEVKRQEILR